MRDVFLLLKLLSDIGILSEPAGELEKCVLLAVRDLLHDHGLSLEWDSGCWGVRLNIPYA